MGVFAFVGNTLCHSQTNANCWGEHLVCSGSLLRHWKLQISIAGTTGMTRAVGPAHVCLCSMHTFVYPFFQYTFPAPFLFQNLYKLAWLPSCCFSRSHILIVCNFHSVSHGNKKGKRSQFQAVFQWNFDQTWNPVECLHQFIMLYKPSLIFEISTNRRSHPVRARMSCLPVLLNLGIWGGASPPHWWRDWPWTRSHWGFIQAWAVGSLCPCSLFCGSLLSTCKVHPLAVAGPCRSNSCENIQDFYFVQVYFMLKNPNKTKPTTNR